MTCNDKKDQESLRDPVSLRAQLAALTPPVLPDLERATELLHDFGAIWDAATPEERRQIVRTLLDAVYLDSGDPGPLVAIAPKPHFAPLFHLTRPTRSPPPASDHQSSSRLITILSPGDDPPRCQL